MSISDIAWDTSWSVHASWVGPLRYLQRWFVMKSFLWIAPELQDLLDHSRKPLVKQVIVFVLLKRNIILPAVKSLVKEEKYLQKILRIIENERNHFIFLGEIVCLHQRYQIKKWAHRLSFKEELNSNSATMLFARTLSRHYLTKIMAQ